MDETISDFEMASGESFESPDCIMTELPYSIEENERLGRHLVAQRNLEQGEIILCEKPIVHGLSRDSCIACFGCYGELDDEEPLCCSMCGLPMCSENCQTTEQHRLGECQALVSADDSSEARRLSLELLDDIPLLHEVVLVLRCQALRTLNPPAWTGLLMMQHHLEARQDSELGARALKVAEFILAELPGLSLDTDLILKILGILDVNSFEIPSSEATVQAIYSTGCLLEHNCIPNAHRSFGPDASICVRTAVPIAAGEHISITYTDSLWPTAERRNHLMYSKHFSCSCNRCRDPTENQTYLGGVRCLKCPVGHYLPENPLEEESDWVCDACAVRVPANYIRHVNSEIGQAIRMMEEAGLEPETCEKFLLVHSRVLHGQHAHMLDVKHSVLHLLGHHEGFLMADLSDKHLQYKEDIARTILSIADKILPGISRLRGTTLYELFHTFQQRGLNWFNNNQRSEKDIISAFRTAETCLRQCIETLQYEPSHRAEGKLFERAKEELITLTDFIQKLTVRPQ